VADPAGSEAPPADQIMALTFDEAGNLWAGSWSRGVLRFDGQAWHQQTEADGLCGKNVWAIAAGSGAVWAACGQDRSGDVARGAGVSRWDGERWTTWTRDQGLPTDDVVALAVAGERAFLGTNTGEGPAQGIVPMTERPQPALTTAGGGRTPASNDVTALTFAPDGTLWAGTRGAGLLERAGEKWRQHTMADTPGLAGDTVTALAIAGGKLYVATTKTQVEGGHYTDGGLSIRDLATGAWRMERAADGRLPDDEIASLAVTGDGRVWVGTGVAQDGPGSGANAQRGDGLAVYDPAENRWAAFTRASTAGGLAGDTVTALATLGGELWAAASYAWDAGGRRVGGGASRLAGGAWRGWPGGAEGLVAFHDDSGVTGDLRAAWVDRTGTPWVGGWTLTDPLELTSRWPRVDAVVNHWDGSAWQADTFRGAGWVSALAEDNVGNGRLWAGTSRGPAGEYSAAGGTWLDVGAGGAWLRQPSGWQNVTPASGGLASENVTAMALEPATGHLWFGTGAGGLSVMEDGRPLATASPTPPGATAAPPPLAGLSLAAAPGVGGVEPHWWALALGLAGLVLMGIAIWLRRRRFEAE
jgi:hypothetical protein